MTDKELIGRIINKDGKAFRELVIKYQQIVFRTCIGFLHNREEAEELTQDVFVEVYQSIERFRNEAKLSTWLYRVSVNKSLNHIKKTRKERSVISLDSIFNPGSENLRKEIGSKAFDENIVDIEERAMILQKAIESLSPNQKIAFTLNKYDELSYKEISEVMDVTVSSVESIIHRAKLNLQKKLVNYFKKE
jgi:RNA polymerase sigma-70 factor, ECF subfamily